MGDNQIKRSVDDRLKQARARREKKKTLIDNIVNSAPKTQEAKQTTSKVETKPTKTKRFKKPPTKSLALATKQLASMVKTGLPIVEALNLVAETTDDKSLKVAFLSLIHI